MLQFLNNNLNPIFVKEIRQFTRSNFIAVLVNLYILLLVLAFLNFLFEFETSNKDMSVIGLLWLTFCYIVLWTCFFSVIVRTVWSTSIERNNSDLMFYSSIKPSTIVFGKLLTGGAITFVLMSVTLPFMVLLNSIGGSHLQYMVLVLIEIFIIVQVMNALAILIASIFKISFAPFISLFLTLIVFGFVNFLVARIIEHWENIGQKPEILFEIIGLFIFEIILFTLFVCATIAKFSPQNSNRSFYVRLVATIIFLTAIICTLFISPFRGLLVYVVLTSFNVLMFFLITVVCEHDQWTPRVRQSLPKSLFRRFILFPFYTGSACGLVWIGLMMVVLVLVDVLALFPLLRGVSLFLCDRKSMMCCWQIILLFLFIFDACVTAMLVRSWFLTKVHTSKVWLLAIPILLLVTLGSYIVAGIYFSINPYSFNFMAAFDLNSIWWKQYKNSDISGINPFMLLIDILDLDNNIYFSELPERFMDAFMNLVNRDVPLSRCYGAIGWAIILLPFLIIWYRQRLKNFSPYNIEESISYEEAKETARNSTVVE
jgi:hypothetical protein